MKHAALATPSLYSASIKTQYLTYIITFLSGLLGPLGFAPFHLPGIAILSVALFYAIISNSTTKHAFGLGFLYGLGYFGFGVSWVIISIHDYGNINYFFSGIATLAFIIYLALFPALVGYFYKYFAFPERKITNLILFSSLWCCSEYLRATLFTGFPWLLIGTTQIDTPIKYLFPIIGIYGVGVITVFCSALLAVAIREQSIKRYYYIIACILILLMPSMLKEAHWTEIKKEPISIGAIQANLAMRDKWDETLFWNLLKYYEETIQSLLGKQLIILPESAIPLPASYLNDYLLNLNNKALAAKSALILGILQPTNDDETNYFNSMVSLGTARGEHVKRQLVPFGEYIPRLFVAINKWLNLPDPNILSGKKKQKLIKIMNHPIASLICYEIAYPNLLRQQLPLAEWIVSISDNGWFGHSLASYQQLQMAQVLSLLTGRYHVVVNNDGLSSIINQHGDILHGLPPFSSGILQGEILPAKGSTPWIILSNYPVFIFCLITFFFVLFLRLRRFQQQ